MDCCQSNNKTKKCIRKEDKKLFDFPRRYTRKQCTSRPIKGFTMRASCAPFKYCNSTNKKGGKKSKREFLYNPNDPKKSFDVFLS